MEPDERAHFLPRHLSGGFRRRPAPASRGLCEEPVILRRLRRERAQRLATPSSATVGPEAACSAGKFAPLPLPTPYSRRPRFDRGPHEGAREAARVTRLLFRKVVAEPALASPVVGTRRGPLARALDQRWSQPLPHYLRSRWPPRPKLLAKLA